MPVAVRRLGDIILGCVESGIEYRGGNRNERVNQAI